VVWRSNHTGNSKIGVVGRRRDPDAHGHRRDDPVNLEAGLAVRDQLGADRGVPVVLRLFDRLRGAVTGAAAGLAVPNTS
jgi:hypothetical protein